MFGRKKRQLTQALEIITDAVKTTTALASHLDETERQRAEAIALLKQALANGDGLLATVAKLQRLYAEAQNRPDAVSVCDETKAVNGWVN